MITYEFVTYYKNGSCKKCYFDSFGEALDKLNCSSRRSELWCLKDGIRIHCVGSNYDDNGLSDFI